jgi:hypothetical protein
LVFQLPDAVAPSLGAIVAIPVRDEEDRIEACLDALLAHRGASPRMPSGWFCCSTIAAIEPRRSRVGVSPPAAHPSPW